MMAKRKAPADSHVCGSKALEGLGNVSKSYAQILTQRERKSKMMRFFGFEIPSGKDLLIFAAGMLVAAALLLLIGKIEMLTGVAG